MENNYPNFPYTNMSFKLNASMLEWNLEVIKGCSLKVSAWCWETVKEGKMSIGKEYIVKKNAFLDCNIAYPWSARTWNTHVHVPISEEKTLFLLHSPYERSYFKQECLVPSWTGLDKFGKRCFYSRSTATCMRSRSIVWCTLSSGSGDSSSVGFKRCTGACDHL